MRFFENNFGRRHVYVFMAMWLAFTVLTYLGADAGADKSEHSQRVWKTTASAITGPIAGAVVRDFQGCCLGFSISLLPFCGGALLIGALVQVIRLPFGTFSGAVRVTAWSLGLLLWFLGIPVSFLHAFS
ncbi:MAG: hypothetical protein WC655_15240 [Candidatus Hydrogenedentales bacterium]|jgi:hypothetical protein